MELYEAALENMYGCVLAPRCADAGEGGWPAPPHGRVNGPIDVLLVGWNPQIDGYPPRPTSYEMWREDGAGGLERAVQRSDAWTRRVGGLIPPEMRLDTGRIVNTRVWKWPSRGKVTTPDHIARARTCSNIHLEQERTALRPRVILTYDKHAAKHFQNLAHERGIPLEPAPENMEHVVAWAQPSSAWGHPCGLLLLKGRQVPYPRETRSWCHDQVRHMLQ